MKKFKYYIISVIVILTIFSSIKFCTAQNLGLKDKFYIGAFNTLWPNYMNIIDRPHWQWYNELSYNFMHGYGRHLDYDTLDGGFFTPVNDYKGRIITNIINRWSTNSLSPRSLILNRSKIERGAYGQSSIYQAEEKDNTGIYWHDKYPGYGYENIYGSVGIDDNDNWYQQYFGGELIRAKHCRKNIPEVPDDQAGFVVANLYENREQVNNVSKDQDHYLFSDYKDTNYKWFVKPRIRIDKDFAMNNPNVDVATIIIFGFDQQQYPTTLKCENFLDNNGQYDGSYKEMFNFGIQNPYSTIFIKAKDLTLDALPDANGRTMNLNNSLVDYRVYWEGNVDMWLDYVKVEDEWAHFLFTDTTPEIEELNNLNPWKFHQKIYAEVDAFASLPGFGYFWSDEAFYNSIPCIAEVNRLVKEMSYYTTALFIPANVDLMRFAGLRNPPTREAIINYLWNSGAVKDILLTGSYPYNIQSCEPKKIAPLPPGLSFTETNGTYYWKVASTRDAYNDFMNQLTFDNDPDFYDGFDWFGIKLNRKVSEFCDAHKDESLVHSWGMQIHSDEGSMCTGRWSWREPTPHEISVQAYLGLAFGARSIMEFQYYTAERFDVEPPPRNPPYTVAIKGMFNPLVSTYETVEKRDKTYYYNTTTNEYLKKWDPVVALHQKIMAIGNYMYPENQSGKFLEHKETRSVHDGVEYHLPCLYLENLKSYFTDNNQTNGGPNWNIPETLTEELVSKRYFEIGFFSPKPGYFEEKYSKFFVAVNKRCAPVFDEVNNDRRTIKLYFHPEQLTVFDNWILKDVISGEQVIFDRSTALSNGVYFPYPFQPGEGKLIKLAPVFQEGGTFVCDESVSNISFNCKGNVYTNYNNLSIGSSTNIKFNEDCGIFAEGGTEFNCNFNNITLEGYGGAKWNGLHISNIFGTGDFSGEVGIQGTSFSNIGYGKAIDIYNCEKSLICGNYFDLTDGLNNAVLNAININNIENTCQSIIHANLINVNKSFAAISIVSAAGTVSTIQIDQNEINNVNLGTSNIGIFISNGNSAELSRNDINNFQQGIFTLSSTAGLRENDINSNKNSSYGICATSGSTLVMQQVAGLIIGKENKIYNTGNNCTNINLDNATFMMNYGRNKFNIINDPLNNHFLGFGNFETHGTAPQYYYDIIENCFNNDIIYNPKYFLEDENGNDITLNHTPHYCLSEEDEEMDFVVPLANNTLDTIYRIAGSNNQYFPNPVKIYKQIYKDIRLKNFDSASAKCTYLLSNYSDSIYSPDIISKLYLSAINIDSAGLKVQPLKTFYEQLIINHPQNITLVKSANYFIQKCKVYLKQYASALLGFQDIINLNPYGYEGLLASWDYAATVLLMDTLNGPGGMSSVDELNEIITTKDGIEFFNDSLRLKKVMKYDNYDKSVFTAPERKNLFITTGSVLLGEREKQIEKVKDLEKRSRSENSSEGSRAKKELADMRALNEAVKTKSPKNQIEYIKIINDDIKNVFKNNSEDSQTKSENIIPKKYELFQNYPNPFNPVTKISFDLPNDSKVKLIVYDILGREIIRLINNEFKPAGKHIIEFNGMNLNLASGVYFYRIEADKFSAVKKMVLIK